MSCVCLSVCLSVCLFACLAGCLSDYMSVCLPACMPACLHAFLPLCLSVCLSVCLPSCPPHQLGVSPVVQYEVLWFEVSVDDAFGMQVSKGLHHAGCIEPCGRVLKGTPGGRRENTVKTVCVREGVCVWVCGYVGK